MLGRKERLFAKKPQLDLSKAEFRVIREGLCVQAMHLGSYDDELATFARIDAYIRDNGLERAGRYHHEIYLGDPRKVAPENCARYCGCPYAERRFYETEKYAVGGARFAGFRRLL